MRRLLALALVTALGLTGGCVKMTNTATVNNDASGTIAMTFALNVAAIEQIKGTLDSMGAPPEAAEQVDQAINELNGLFDEKKITESLKASGLEVTSAKRGDKDGWRTMDVAARFADVNAWIEKAGKVVKQEADKSPLPFAMPGGDIGALVPKFYKTDRDGVGELVIFPPLEGNLPDMPDPDEMGDEERDMVDEMVNSMKTAFSVDQMKVEMTFNLPGKVVDVKGAKKEGEKGLRFSLAGADINLDGVKTLFGMKHGVSATFEIPEDCKIRFADKTAKKTEEAKETEEPGEKKGGLKIGGDK